MRKLVAPVGVSLLLLVAACGDSDTGSPSASTPGTASSAAGGAVVVKGTAALKFEPATLTATKGRKFEGTFTQSGAVPHNLEIKDFGVTADSTMVTKDGESKPFSFTPDKTGEFTFVCTLHPGQMTGKLTVS